MTPQSRGLALIVLAGFALRLWGVDFGLDRGDASRAVFNNHVDELTIVDAILHRFLRGDLHPGPALMWGSTGYYLFGLVDVLALLPRALFGGGGFQGAVARLETNPSDLFLIHRVVAAIASTLTIVVVHRIAARVGGPRVAWIAALFAACGYLVVREAHYGILESTAALWTVLLIGRALALADDASVSSYAKLGALFGLAVTTKYQAAGLAPALIVAHFLARGARARAGAIPPPASRLLAAGAAALATALALSPHLFYAPRDLFEAMDSVSRVAYPRADLAILAVNANRLFGRALWFGFGELPCALAVVGGAIAWRGRRVDGAGARFVVLAALTIPPMFAQVALAARYAVSLAALLSVPAATACDRIASRATRAPRAALAALLAIALAPSLARIVSFDLLVGRTDTRVELLEFLRRSGAPPSDVVAVGFFGLPRPTLGPFEAPFVDYVARVHYDRSLTREAGRALRPRFLVHDTTSGVEDSAAWSDFAATAEREYRVALTLDGRRDGATPVLPDPRPGTPPQHFVPFDRPWDMTRPGPGFVVYERTAR